MWNMVFYKGEQKQRGNIAVVTHVSTHTDQQGRYICHSSIQIIMLMRKKIILAVFMSLFFSAMCTSKENVHDWTKLINAVAQVESGGNPKVTNSAGCAGLLQITKVCVRQCNKWLREEKSDKRYTYADRYDSVKSKEMFVLVQKHCNPKNDLERAIRIWKGGPGYTRKGTNGYYRRVMREYKKAGK